MKRINVKNGFVDTVELHITDDSAKPGSFVVPDNIEVFGDWIDNGDGTFTAPDQEPEGPHAVSKYTIIVRLDAAGKFAEALVALKTDDLLYQKWLAVTEIKSDDQPARDLFTAIGLDPDVILAKEG